MRLLFTFENALPSRLADAEVSVQTAKALAQRWPGARMLVPGAQAGSVWDGDLELRRCRAPLRFALLRHLFMALSLPFRRELREHDAVYTRNLLVAAVAVLCRAPVVFDHYRPWGDQLPPLQPFLRWLLNHPRLLLVVCHSQLTLRCYTRIGIDGRKLVAIHTGFDPALLEPAASSSEARRGLGLSLQRPLVVYTGRVNHKKGLDVVLAAARLSPGVDFLLVGAEGGSPIEAAARAIPNVTLIGFQPPRKLARYLHAADLLLIPPASAPLQLHGSTVLPLKTFLYLGAGKPIIAGATPDNREVLAHGTNAWLVEPDRPQALASAVATLLADPVLTAGLAAGARAAALDASWSARAQRIQAALDARLAARQPAPSSAWLSESARWLLHLLRTGRWAMPHAYSATDRVSEVPEAKESSCLRTRTSTRTVTA